MVGINRSEQSGGMEKPAWHTAPAAAKERAWTLLVPFSSSLRKSTHESELFQLSTACSREWRGGGDGED